MKRFSFRFQTVLDVKRQREEALKRELSAREARLLEARNYLESLLDRESTTLETFKEKLLGEFSLLEIDLFQDYLEKLVLAIEESKAWIIQLEAWVEEKRAEVVEALKARKIVEKIKEKDHNVYKKQVARADQNFLDEMVTTHYRRDGKVLTERR